MSDLRNARSELGKNKNTSARHSLLFQEAEGRTRGSRRPGPLPGPPGGRRYRRRRRRWTSRPESRTHRTERERAAGGRLPTIFTEDQAATARLLPDQRGPPPRPAEAGHTLPEQNPSVRAAAPAAPRSQSSPESAEAGTRRSRPRHSLERSLRTSPPARAEPPERRPSPLPRPRGRAEAAGQSGPRPPRRPPSESVRATSGPQPGGQRGRRDGSRTPLGPRAAGGPGGPARPGPASLQIPSPAEAASARLPRGCGSACTGAPRARRRNWRKEGGGSEGCVRGRGQGRRRSHRRPRWPRALRLKPGRPPAPGSPLSGASAARAQAPPSPRGHLADSRLADASRGGLGGARADGRCSPDRCLGRCGRRGRATRDYNAYNAPGRQPPTRVAWERWSLVRAGEAAASAECSSAASLQIEVLLVPGLGVRPYRLGRPGVAGAGAAGGRKGGARLPCPPLPGGPGVSLPPRAALLPFPAA